MKNLLTLVVSFILLLTGCASADAVNGENILLAADCNIIEISDKPLPITDNENPCYANENKVFHSYDELQEYIAGIEKCDSTEKIIAMFNSYDESFFETSVLFYGYESGTGNVIHEFKGAKLINGEDGKSFVEIKAETDWDKCIESGACYCYFVKLDKCDVENVADENFSVVTYSK